MAVTTISISDTMMDFVKRQMKRRGFMNVSEYFRFLLRNAQEQESAEKIETLLVKGLEGGTENKLTREFWRDLKTEAVHLLKRSVNTQGV